MMKAQIKPLKKLITVILAVCILLQSLIITLPVLAKDNVYLMKWNKSDILDDHLNISNFQARDDEILLDLEFHTNGQYVLEYYLEKQRKSRITIKKGATQVDIDYNVLFVDGSNGDGASITETMRDAYYAERNYEINEMVEDPAKPINADGAI